MPETIDAELFHRWPDRELLDSYQTLLLAYRDLVRMAFRRHGVIDLTGSFGALCDSLAAAASGQPPQAPVSLAAESVLSKTTRTLETLRGDWLQRLASLLAMLMHFSPSDEAPDGIVNRRRPQVSFSTYPTAPAVVRLVCESLLDLLPLEPIPKACHTTRAAARYADRVYDFRVIDPSMESGQLLIGIAQAAIRKVDQQHPPGTAAGRRLRAAILEKLFDHTLVGIDRSPLAARAVALLTSLMASRYGLTTGAAGLLQADSIEVFANGDLGPFDAVANNPPWNGRPSEVRRAQLRRLFTTIAHRTDEYVAFAEMAIRWLKPGGAFALVLPGQAVAAHNASGLRALITRETRLTNVTLLPRAPFADASVRAAALFGRKDRKQRAGQEVSVVAYTPSKRLLPSKAPEVSSVSYERLASAGDASWIPLLNSGRVALSLGSVVPLGRVADTAVGVQVYGNGKGHPPQNGEALRRRRFTSPASTPDSVPALRGRDVRPYYLAEPKIHVLFGQWLAYVGHHHQHRQRQRVLLREICGRDGRLSAALAEAGPVPLHGVLTILPLEVNPLVLVGLLNSGSVARWVRTSCASFTKLDYQKISTAELRRLPIPVAALDSAARRKLGLHNECSRGEAHRTELMATVSKAMKQAQRGGVVPDTLERVDQIVAALYVNA